MTAQAPLFEAVAVSKRYEATQALDGVDFAVRPGEIHALLGENGAGKSTLVGVMGGAVQPDSGALRWGGEEVIFRSPGDAIAAGVVVVHQELALMPHLTVAENIFISEFSTANRERRGFGIVNRREIRRRATEVLDQLGFKLSPGAVVNDLNQSQRQLVEIARALVHDARLILLDEPTSSLPPHERHELADRLAELRNQGLAIVLVTHLLAEAHAMSDSVTVLRDGRKVDTKPTEEVDVNQLVSMMTGKEQGTVFPDTGAVPAEDQVPRLEVRGLASEPSVKDVTFSVGPGEIVGLAGLVGSGRTGTLETIFGARARTRGEVLVDGKPLGQHSILRAIEHGLAFIPEDRQSDGLLAEQSVLTNITVTAVQTPRGVRVTRFGGRLLSRSLIRKVGLALIEQVKIKVDDPRRPVHTLSGGNQQKVILARWLAMKPAIVLADDPTRGVSIGSKIEIYKLIRALADGGSSIVLVSSEFEELTGIANRIIVMRDGRSISTIGSAAIAKLDADGLLYLVLSSRTSDQAAVA
jgi:ABC-type sugar transport system ATPase subunit